MPLKAHHQPEELGLGHGKVKCQTYGLAVELQGGDKREEGYVSDLETHLLIAQELDRMERDVTSWEAGFLESVLKRLNRGNAITDKQVNVLNRMHEKYLGAGAAQDIDEEEEG